MSIDFTNDSSSVIEFMNSVEAIYGADDCEDIFGGLEKVINLSWKNPNRILIHVGDAPQHGTRYAIGDCFLLLMSFEDSPRSRGFRSHY